jgi:hypothetical protein
MVTPFESDYAPFLVYDFYIIRHGPLLKHLNKAIGEIIMVKETLGKKSNVKNSMEDSTVECSQLVYAQAEKPTLHKIVDIINLNNKLLGLELANLEEIVDTLGIDLGESSEKEEAKPKVQGLAYKIVSLLMIQQDIVVKISQNTGQLHNFVIITDGDRPFKVSETTKYDNDDDSE